MVKIVFYVTKPQLFSEEIARFFSWSLLQPIEILTVHESQELITSVIDLSDEKIILVLAVSSNKELEELFSLNEILNSIPKILILPDNRLETLQTGMLLSPVYFMTIHDDFSHIASVIMSLSNIYLQYYDPQRKSFSLGHPERPCQVKIRTRPGNQ